MSIGRGHKLHGPGLDLQEASPESVCTLLLINSTRYSFYDNVPYTNFLSCFIFGSFQRTWILHIHTHIPRTTVIKCGSQCLTWLRKHRTNNSWLRHAGPSLITKWREQHFCTSLIWHLFIFNVQRTFYRITNTQTVNSCRAFSYLSHKLLQWFWCVHLHDLAHNLTQCINTDCSLLITYLCNRNTSR